MIAHKCWIDQKKTFEPDSKFSCNPDRRVTSFLQFCPSSRPARDKRISSLDTSTFVVKFRQIPFLKDVSTRIGICESYSLILAGCKTRLSKDHSLLDTHFVGHKKLKKAAKHLLILLAAYLRLARPSFVSNLLRGLSISTDTCK